MMGEERRKALEDSAGDRDGSVTVSREGGRAAAQRYMWQDLAEERGPTCRPNSHPSMASAECHPRPLRSSGRGSGQ